MLNTRRDVPGRGIGALTVRARPPAVRKPRGRPAPSAGSKHRWAMGGPNVRQMPSAARPCTVVHGIFENAVPPDSFRTIVSTYEVQEDAAGADGDAAAALQPLRRAAVASPVCPVRRHFQRPDGNRGGRRRPMRRLRPIAFQACPYDARFINAGDAESRQVHVLRPTGWKPGLLPACVESCVGGARMFGDLERSRQHRSQAGRQGRRQGAQARARHQGRTSSILGLGRTSDGQSRRGSRRCGGRRPRRRMHDPCSKSSTCRAT